MKIEFSTIDVDSNILYICITVICVRERQNMQCLGLYNMHKICSEAHTLGLDTFRWFEILLRASFSLALLCVCTVVTTFFFLLDCVPLQWLQYHANPEKWHPLTTVHKLRRGTMCTGSLHNGTLGKHGQLAYCVA